MARELPPKSIIQLPPGIFYFQKSLGISTDNIVLRGHGTTLENGTVLRFDKQLAGSAGIAITGNNFVIEQLAIENAPGDGLRLRGTNGAIVRQVRVEWTNGPDRENGGYGIYPIQSKNILIEKSQVRGASDAGIYVGQSENIIVRDNIAYENVAGIEIENTHRADIYKNHLYANTGGILVFNVPGAPVLGSYRTRVFENIVEANNTPNFARKGNIVSMVAAGTGIMILASDDVQIERNTLSDNQAVGILVASYFLRGRVTGNPLYDPLSNRVSILRNHFESNGSMASDRLDPLVTAGIPQDAKTVNVVYDISTPMGALKHNRNKSDTKSTGRTFCVESNVPTDIFYEFAIDYSHKEKRNASHTTTTNCPHEPLTAVVLAEQLPPQYKIDQYRTTIDKCDTNSENWKSEAYRYNCPKLSDYQLFESNGNPRVSATDGRLYDLNTPLFSDYTTKYRHLHLPRGAVATYSEYEVLDFPVGTILSKTFAAPLKAMETERTDILLETRLLLRRRDGWEALTYLWDEKATEATLSLDGASRSISMIDHSGNQQKIMYQIPSQDDCATCHGERQLVPIGPTARSLNVGELDDMSTSSNQLARWARDGILSKMPDSSRDLPRIVPWDDQRGDLTLRARGYLDVNCAHCHSPTGSAYSSGLLLDIRRPRSFALGVCKPPVAAGRGSGELSHIIVPGDAKASILSYRIHATEIDVRMPELGRSVVHTEGAILIDAWIDSMKSQECVQR